MIIIQVAWRSFPQEFTGGSDALKLVLLGLEEVVLTPRQHLKAGRVFSDARLDPNHGLHETIKTLLGKKAVDKDGKVKPWKCLFKDNLLNGTGSGERGGGVGTRETMNEDWDDDVERCQALLWCR